MRNRKIRISFLLVLFISICIYLTSVPIGAAAENAAVYLGGQSAGFSLETRGATVIGLSDVIGEEKLFSPSKDADIRAGDVILSLDGQEINTALDVEKILNGYDGNGITATILRDDERLVKLIYPKKDLSGKYKLGVFIRDTLTGIGTLTFVREDLRFGALGHPVLDATHQNIVSIKGGRVYRSSITGVKRGEKGKAGELKGIFLEDTVLGKLDKNVEQGIFGNITDKSFVATLQKVETGKAKVGKATMFTTVDGITPKEYTLNIVKVDEANSENKNLVLKITDEELIDLTGGILQGMSGSPILQDGKLVGAVTHVFLNDSTRGFGIMIDNMLNQ